METKDILAKYGHMVTEEKARRVRTPAGAKRFGQPIGAIIVRDLPLNNIRILNPIWSGWDLIQDKKGRKYDVGKDEDGKWRAYSHGDWDSVVAEADDEDDLFEALDRKAGGGKASAKAPVAKKRPAASGGSGSGDKEPKPSAVDPDSRSEREAAINRLRKVRDETNATYARAMRGATGARLAGLRAERDANIDRINRDIQKAQAALDGDSGSEAKPSPDKPFGEYTAKMKGLWAKSPTARKNARMKAERSIDAKDRESLIDMSQGEADRYLELRAVGADHDTAKRLSKGSKRGEPVWGTPAEGEASGGVSKRTSTPLTRGGRKTRSNPHGFNEEGQKVEADIWRALSWSPGAYNSDYRIDPKERRRRAGVKARNLINKHRDDLPPAAVEAMEKAWRQSFGDAGKA